MDYMDLMGLMLLTAPVSVWVHCDQQLSHPIWDYIRLLRSVGRDRDRNRDRNRDTGKQNERERRTLGIEVRGEKRVV